jgi:hypothetical protein
MPLQKSASPWSHEAANRQLAGVDFTLPQPTTCVEFRLQVESHVSLELTRVRLRNVGPAAVTVVTP